MLKKFSFPEQHPQPLSEHILKRPYLLRCDSSFFFGGDAKNLRDLMKFPQQTGEISASLYPRFF